MSRWVIYTLVWLGLMFASLQLQRIDLGHALCGAWGCGPPASPLLSMHAFWFALILPPSVYAARMTPLPWKTIGLFVAIISFGGLLVFGGYDYFGINRSFYDAGYVWQRYLLSLASFGVNVPLIQLFATGLVLFLYGRQCKCCAKPDGKPVLDSLATHCPTVNNDGNV